jgi:predicted restriction endonuclease
MGAMRKWSEDELRLALALYCQLPFGKMHSRNPEIIRLAEKLGRTPSAVAMKLVNFASLDPEIAASGRAGLGNASTMDRLVWEKFQQNWENELLPAAKALDPAPEEPSVAEATTRKAEVEIRTKQSLFRRMVLGSYAGLCCMSGLSEPRLLVASHIVPWNKNSDHRLNPRNGLCLSVLHDKAFDRGLITVGPDLAIRVSPEISRLRDDSFVQATLVAMGGRKIRLPEKFSPSPEFLEWHNKRVFIG